MYLSTQVPLRARQLTRRQRRDDAFAYDHGWFFMGAGEWCDCCYRLFDFDDGDAPDPSSIEGAIWKRYVSMCGRTPPLRAAVAQRAQAGGLSRGCEPARAPRAAPRHDLPRALAEHVEVLLWGSLPPYEESAERWDAMPFPLPHRPAPDPSRCAEAAARWDAMRPSLAAAKQRIDGCARSAPQGAAVFKYVPLFAPFWIRTPETWRPPPGGAPPALVASLVEHLFARRLAPRPLLRVWCGESTAALKWVCWYILLAQGASLRRAAYDFGWAIPEGFTERFVEAPEALDPEAACRWAEVARRGGDAADFERLQLGEGGRVDPTELRGSVFAEWQEYAEAWAERSPHPFHHKPLSVGARLDAAESLRLRWLHATG